MLLYIFAYNTTHWPAGSLIIDFNKQEGLGIGENLYGCFCIEVRIVIQVFILLSMSDGIEMLGRRPQAEPKSHIIDKNSSSQSRDWSLDYYSSLIIFLNFISWLKPLLLAG